MYTRTRDTHICCRVFENKICLIIWWLNFTKISKKGNKFNELSKKGNEEIGKYTCGCMSYRLCGKHSIARIAEQIFTCSSDKPCLVPFTLITRCYRPNLSHYGDFNTEITSTLIKSHWNKMFRINDIFGFNPFKILSELLRWHVTLFFMIPFKRYQLNNWDISQHLSYNCLK